MFFMRSLLLIALVATQGWALSIPKRRSDSTSPVVTLQDTSFQGRMDVDNVQVFLGMPYAQPPIGDLRFRQPQALKPNNTVQQAVSWPAACPQQNYTIPHIEGIDYEPLIGMPTQAEPNEDCLYANVFRPADVDQNAKLPVIVWIYGGGFETGDSSAFNATSFVSRSVALGEPVIYASFNYRLNGFGFLGGKEAMENGAANLGLFDQRFALEWLQENIAAFGGDPDRVTLWGQSAGSVSITAHIVTNPGNSTLFHGAVMHSTSTSPMLPADHAMYQETYDFLVNQTGCTSQSDTFECLRKAPYDTLMGAINQTPSMFSPRGLNLTYAHTVDGNFFNKTLKQYVHEGTYARIPIVFGTVDDEGSLFTLTMAENVTDDQGARDLIQTYYLPNANETVLDQVLEFYPEDMELGSPWDTPNITYENKEFKRLAAFQGDFINQAARRDFLSVVSETQPTWSFLWKRNKDGKYLGSVHMGELPEFYSRATNVSDCVATDLVVNFINTGNPNLPQQLDGKTDSLLSNVTWPEWRSNPESPPMFLFSDDPSASYGFVGDNYRWEEIGYLNELQLDDGV